MLGEFGGQFAVNEELEVITLGDDVDGVPVTLLDVGHGQHVGLDRIAEHERDLLNYATQQMASVDGLSILGTAAGKVSVISFTMDCAHPHDVSTIVDQQGVAVRAGHHCAQPLMDFFDVGSTTRASFALYNTRAEVDALVVALEKVRKIFA